MHIFPVFTSAISWLIKNKWIYCHSSNCLAKKSVQKPIQYIFTVLQYLSLLHSRLSNPYSTILIVFTVHCPCHATFANNFAHSVRHRIFARNFLVQAAWHTMPCYCKYVVHYYGHTSPCSIFIFRAVFSLNFRTNLLVSSALL